MKNERFAFLLSAVALLASVSAVAKEHDEIRPGKKPGVVYEQSYRDGREDARPAVLIQGWRGRGNPHRYADTERAQPATGSPYAADWRSVAKEMGYQDGINDGLKDFRTGHSYRPTQGDNYKSAARGYSDRFGEKNTYKQVYREGYASGYQRGYYNNPSGGRR